MKILGIDPGIGRTGITGGGAGDRDGLFRRGGGGLGVVARPGAGRAAGVAVAAGGGVSNFRAARA